MRDICTFIIHPKCRETGKSYALNLNPKGLKIDVFVTHSWNGIFADFVESLRYTFQPRIRKPNLWICAFALLQSDDEAAIAQQIRQENDALEQSPFVKALAEAPCCCVVRNSNKDLYSRIWCVCELMYATQYELFPDQTYFTGQNKFAQLQTSCVDAQASREDDRSRILKVLLQEHELDTIDAIVHQFRTHEAPSNISYYHERLIKASKVLQSIENPFRLMNMAITKSLDAILAGLPPSTFSSCEYIFLWMIKIVVPLRSICYRLLSCLMSSSICIRIANSCTNRRLVKILLVPACLFLHGLLFESKISHAKLMDTAYIVHVDPDQIPNDQDQIPNALLLTENNFDNFTVENEIAFVYVSVPWSDLSRSLGSHGWDKLARSTQSLNLTLGTAKLNCEDELTLCHEKNLLSINTASFKWFLLGENVMDCEITSGCFRRGISPGSILTVYEWVESLETYFLDLNKTDIMPWVMEGWIKPIEETLHGESWLLGKSDTTDQQPLIQFDCDNRFGTVSCDENYRSHFIELLSYSRPSLVLSNNLK